MPRKPRNFQDGYSYHITTCCNNREFKLAKRDCREVFLYALKKALQKHHFKPHILHVTTYYDDSMKTEQLIWYKLQV